MVVDCSRLSPMKGLDCTEDGNGPLPVTLRGRSQSVTNNLLFGTFVTNKLQLFGGSAFAKEALGLSDYNAATWTQNFIASIAGASASLIVSAPLDVIKTRIQNK